MGLWQQLVFLTFIEVEEKSISQIEKGSAHSSNECIYYLMEKAIYFTLLNERALIVPADRDKYV